MRVRSVLIVMALAALANFKFLDQAQAAQPPATNLKLWLKADTGVSTNADGTVTEWADQAVGVKHNGTNTVSAGFPVLVMNPEFPSGPQPTLHFDGSSALVLANRDDLQIPTISVYVVAAVDNTVPSGVFIADLRDPFGFVLGVSDSTPGRARWYTGVPNHNIEPAAADLANNVPYLVEGTFTDDRKAMFLNGAPVGSATGLALNFATWSVLGVGAQGTYPASGELETGDPPNLSKFLTGDIAEILVYSAVSDAQRLAVEAYIYQKYFTQPSGPVTLVTQPVNQQIDELGSVTFMVKADGAPPLSYQWMKDGQNLPGADGPYYTIASVARTDGGQFSVKVSNAQGSVTSDNASLTVIFDTTPPTLLSADRDFLDPTKVLLAFSKPVSAATATATANYAIDNGITVTGAALGTAPGAVVLTTTTIAYGPAYMLTVNGVQDLVGNTIAANTQRRITVPDPNAPVPTVGLKLWLRADVGVTANPDGVVTAWADHQVGNPPKNGTAVGTPILWQGQFANGPHPVITFDGLSGFNLDNVADMRMTNMTFYVVTSVAAINTSRIMIGNYRDVAGWGIGISDGIPGRVKWFTAPPNSMEPEGAQLSEGEPVLLTATYSSVGGFKNLYVGTNLVGSATGVNLAYATDTQLTVGYLQGNRQYLMGDIAEILVYSEVSESQRALVHAYLNRKYFGQGTGPVTVTLQPQSQTIDELKPVTFEVGFDGAPPVSIQWLRNGAVIAGATDPVYTIPSVTRNDQGAQFSARLSNSINTVTSSNATLTVILDTVAPTLVAAKAGFLNNSQVTVIFSKDVSVATATQAGNYAINNGATVSAAAMGLNARTVVLTTSAIAPGQNYTLTVNGVQDLVGNSVAANSQIPLIAPASALRPPTANLVLWLAADAGVTTSDGHTVTGWADQAGGPTPHNGSSTVGSPQLVLTDFNNGPSPVIRFNGASGIVLDNPYDMDLQQYSISVVGSVNNKIVSQEFIAHWPGMAFGISDGTPGRVKWVSHGPDHSMEPVGASLANNVPYLLTGTMDAGVVKKLYVNTVEVGTASEIAVFFESDSLTVGMLFNTGAQFLTGTVAEILAYSAVSEAQRTAVEAYLNAKYGNLSIAPDSTPPTLVSARRILADHNLVRVTFSEPVSAATATVVANYSINGVTITGAAIGQTPEIVELTTSGVGEGSFTLTVNGVRDIAGNPIAANSQAVITLVPLIPAEIGTTVNGFQDDFEGATRDPNWLPIGPDVYTQAGGVLQVHAGGGDPNHLIYIGAAYNPTNQEILARIQLRNLTTQEHALAGVALAVPTNSLSLDVKGGLNTLFVNPGAFGGPAVPHVVFLNDYTGFGPVIDFKWTTNTWYWMRLRQEPNTAAGQPDAFVKVWPADGDTAEPGTWQGTFDYANIRSGYAGVRAGILSVAGLIGDYDVDYLLIKADGLPSITVAPKAFAPGAPRQQDAGTDGLLVLEAEHYDNAVPAQGHSWVLGTSPAGFSGDGVVQALPNDPNLNVQNDPNSPRLDFRVNFVKTGTHYIWVRGLGDSTPGGSVDDSLNTGLNGQMLETSRRISGFPQGAGYVWSKGRVDPTVDIGAPRFDVDAPGAGVVNVWMRENGLVIDKLVITTNPNYALSGLGPAESPLLGPPELRLNLARSGDQIVLSWTGTATLQSADEVTGTWTDVVGTSPQTITPTAAHKFYRLRQ